jgi:WD40 repeat protein
MKKLIVFGLCVVSLSTICIYVVYGMEQKFKTLRIEPEKTGVSNIDVLAYDKKYTFPKQSLERSVILKNFMSDMNVGNELDLNDFLSKIPQGIWEQVIQPALKAREIKDYQLPLTYDLKTLIAIGKAADFLDIPYLTHAVSQGIATNIKQNIGFFTKSSKLLREIEEELPEDMIEKISADIAGPSISLIAKKSFIARKEFTPASPALSPDGTMIAEAIWSPAFSVAVWDITTGNKSKIFTGHADVVNSIAFTPDGNALVSGSEDGTIKVWNVHTGQKIKTLLKQEKDNIYAVRSMALSPDGKLLASGLSGGNIELWDLTTGELRGEVKAHEYFTSSLAFSSDGKTLASACEGEDVVKLWDVATIKLAQTISAGDNVYSLAFNPDDKMLAAGLGGAIKMLDLSRGKEMAAFRSDNADAITQVVFTSQGRYLISGSQDGTIQVWEVATGKRIETVGSTYSWEPDHHGQVSSLALSPNKKMLASVFSNGTIKLWDILEFNFTLEQAVYVRYVLDNKIEKLDESKLEELGFDTEQQSMLKKLITKK